MIEAGIKNRKEDIVTEQNCASALGSGLLDVYGTPSMVALMEGCCHESVEPYLDEGCGTVGISLNIQHLAATPIGMKVYCESELVKTDGRFMTFEVNVYDEKGIIGKGEHERCVIRTEKFREKAYKKAEKTGE